MPDTHVTEQREFPGRAKSALNAALAGAQGPHSAYSLLMVGLMGNPRWLRPGTRWAEWLAAVLARPLAPRGGRARSAAGIGDDWPAQGAPGIDQAHPRGTISHYVRAALFVAAASVICLALHPFLLVGSLVLPYLIAVLLAAIGYGLLPSLFASVLSLLCFDFFFLPPFYSLIISEPDDLLRLVVFGLAALIVSNLAAYARGQAVAAGLRADIAEDLYRFGRLLAGAGTLREVIDASMPKLATILRSPVFIALPDDGDVVIYRQGPDHDPASGETAAHDVFTGTEFAFIKSWLKSLLTQAWLPEDHLAEGTGTLPPVSPRWRLVPMRSGQRTLGVLGVTRSAMNSLEAPNSDALLGTLADLLAQTIHRIDLIDDLTLANRVAEREELHATLLASLSHDLRTPLASVIANADNLVDYREEPWEHMQEHTPEDARQAMVHSIRSEARRLDRYIGDLLDMTRLESGLADGRKGRIDLADAVSVALDRCATGLAAHHVNVELANDLPLLAGDEVLLEHVLFNLLDNAAKYTPAGSMIRLRAFRDQNDVKIELTDEGSGIRPVDLERIFDKFYRGRRQGPRSPGIGLGLSICRGYVEAMGGRIVARNRSDRAGAVFLVMLPVPTEEDLPGLDA